MPPETRLDFESSPTCAWRPQIPPARVRRFFFADKIDRASGRYAGAMIASTNKFGEFGSSFRVDHSVQSNNRTKCRNGIRFVRLDISFANEFPIAVPHGFVCLMMQQAGASNS